VTSCSSPSGIEHKAMTENYNWKMVMTENYNWKMASQSSLESFNHAVESIEDYKEQFDFYCTTHQIPEARRKALFLTRIGRDAFAKLKTLVSPTPLSDVSLTAIVTTMMQNYNKDTVEIVSFSSISNVTKKL